MMGVAPDPVLIVSPNQREIHSCREWLGEKGIPVLGACSAPEAIVLHGGRAIPFTLTDIDLPGIDGIELLCRIKVLNPQAHVALFGATNWTESAVASIKAGATDFLEKPLDRSRLVRLVDTVTQECDRSTRTDGFASLFERFDLEGVVCRSPALGATLELAMKVAPLDCTVLVTGQSGTGKGILARAIHRNSRRRHSSFVSINCAAIPEGLLESELFGYRRGAFTGAERDKAGLLESSRGGTVFLDEIAEIDLAIQAKLLHFLENRVFFPVGSVEPVEADVRVVAATNASLERLVETGQFREDLYYRLNVIPLAMPPLTERPQDIVPLAEHFLSNLADQVGKPVPGISREAASYLESLAWRGNVRQLANAIEYAVIVSQGNLLTSSDFRVSEATASTSREFAGTEPWVLPPEGLDLDSVVRSLTRQALERTGDRLDKAAHLLGISRATLKYRAKKYGFRHPPH